MWSLTRLDLSRALERVDVDFIDKVAWDVGYEMAWISKTLDSVLWWYEVIDDWFLDFSWFKIDGWPISDLEIFDLISLDWFSRWEELLTFNHY